MSMKTTNISNNFTDVIIILHEKNPPFRLIWNKTSQINRIFYHVTQAECRVATFVLWMHCPDVEVRSDKSSHSNNDGHCAALTADLLLLKKSPFLVNSVDRFKKPKLVWIWNDSELKLKWGLRSFRRRRSPLDWTHVSLLGDDADVDPPCASPDKTLVFSFQGPTLWSNSKPRLILATYSTCKKAKSVGVSPHIRPINPVCSAVPVIKERGGELKRLAWPR